METEKLKKLIGNAHIKERIKYLSYGVNEKEASENELWLTIWKVGYINVSWTKKGFQPYPDAFLKEIREIIRLPLVNVWDHFDKQGAIEDGIPESHLERWAIQWYLENFDLDQYLSRQETLEEVIMK
jgi:hypothetical protein